MNMQWGKRPTWRNYQTRLKRKSDLKNILCRIRWAAVAICAMMLISPGIKAYFRPDTLNSTQTEEAAQSLPIPVSFEPGIGKREIRGWLSPESVSNLEKKSFDIRVDQQHFRVDTSLDLPLQALLLKKVRSSDAELMGLVVLDPDDGRVLAMVGVNQDHSSSNPCFDNRFPAASIFKIVTAAAAIEQSHFTPQTILTFNGGKYTLYKSQLKNTVNRYTNTISFRDSFAQSVNPVFGKIGAQVGKASLESYGRAFGFNQEIDFEVALPSSTLEVNGEAYHLAEIGCGFNRITTLTPIHGALIAAAVLNGGRLPEPTMIEQIVDENGREIYQSSPSLAGEAMSSGTSTLLEKMMTQTVRTGTCQKIFANAAKDRVLSKLEIGGKSGSIDNLEHTRRMDWFVGFAREKNGTEKIAVAVVVGHGRYIGTKAAEFARYTIRSYFKEYSAATERENIRAG